MNKLTTEFHHGIKHMCKQCAPGALSPLPPPRLGTRLETECAHAELCDYHPPWTETMTVPPLVLPF